MTARPPVKLRPASSGGTPLATAPAVANGLLAACWLDAAGAWLKMRRMPSFAASGSAANSCWSMAHGLSYTAAATAAQPRLPERLVRSAEVLAP